MTDLRPSPALLAAVTEALAILKRHHGAQMRLALDVSAEGRAYTADYCRTLAGCGPSFIVAAAETWLATGEKFAPKPGELAKMARDLERRSGPERVVAIPRVLQPRTDPHTQMLTKFALEELGSWTLVTQVWAMLEREAKTDPELLAALRDGTVAHHRFTMAVHSVRNGERGSAGPLAETMGLAPKAAPAPVKHKPEPYEAPPRQWCSSQQIPRAR